jgi:ATP-binding cassette subfamily B protein
MNTSQNNWYRFFIFSGCWTYYLLILVCIALTSYLGLIIPKYLLQLNETFKNHDLFLDTIFKFALIYLAIYVVRTAYQLVINIYIRDLMNAVRNKVYRVWLLNHEFKGGDNYFPQGEVIARIMSDSMSLRELVTSGALGIIIDLFYVLFFLIGFIELNKFSGIFLAIVEVLVALGLIYGGKYMRTVFHQVRKSKGMVSQTLANVLGGINQSYFSLQKEYTTKEGEKSFSDFLSKQLKANNWDAFYYSMAESL